MMPRCSCDAVMSRKRQLVGAFAVVDAGDLHRVAGVAQLEKLDAFDDPAGFDIEARNDSFCQHKSV